MTEFATDLSDLGVLRGTSRVQPSTPAANPAPDPTSVPTDPALRAYLDLLTRVQPLLKKTEGAKKKVSLPPVVSKFAAKRTTWANFTEMAGKIDRLKNLPHLLAWVLSELSVEGNVDGIGQLVLKGKYRPADLERVFARYTLTYVVCGACKSLGTTYEKDPVLRLTFVQCTECGSKIYR